MRINKKILMATVPVGALLIWTIACSSGKGTAKPAAEKPAAAPTQPSTPAPQAKADASSPWAGVTPTAANIKEAKSVFKTNCATCHGMNGSGDGPAAAGLKPKPRDYHDQAWQKTVTDEHIEKTIVDGGAAVGLSGVMPPHPDLKNKPGVVVALKDMIRKFGQEPAPQKK